MSYANVCYNVQEPKFQVHGLSYKSDEMSRKADCSIIVSEALKRAQQDLSSEFKRCNFPALVLSAKAQIKFGLRGPATETLHIIKKNICTINYPDQYVKDVCMAAKVLALIESEEASQMVKIAVSNVLNTSSDHFDKQHPTFPLAKLAKVQALIDKKLAIGTLEKAKNELKNKPIDDQFLQNYAWKLITLAELKLDLDQAAKTARLINQDYCGCEFIYVKVIKEIAKLNIEEAFKLIPNINGYMQLKATALALSKIALRQTTDSRDNAIETLSKMQKLNLELKNDPIIAGEIGKVLYKLGSIPDTLIRLAINSVFEEGARELLEDDLYATAIKIIRVQTLVNFEGALCSASRISNRYWNAIALAKIAQVVSKEINNDAHTVHTDNLGTIIQEVQSMFSHINEANHWGVANGEEYVPYCCLTCGKVKYSSLNEFTKYGPELNVNKWFCSVHVMDFLIKINSLTDLSRNQGKDPHESFEIAVKPLREKEKNLEKLVKFQENIDDMNKLKIKNWVMIE